jgi:hypothetical protein
MHGAIFESTYRPENYCSERCQSPLYMNSIQAFWANSPHRLSWNEMVNFLVACKANFFPLRKGNSPRLQIVDVVMKSYSFWKNVCFLETNFPKKMVSYSSWH